MSIELPVTTRQRRDMTDNVESDVKPEQTNKQTNKIRQVTVSPLPGACETRVLLLSPHMLIIPSGEGLQSELLDMQII